MTLNRVHSMVFVLSVTALLAACGGSSATTAPATAAASGETPAPAGTVSQPSAAPSVTAASAAPSSAPSSAPLPSVGDLSKAATALSNVSSYKVSIVTTGGSRPGTETVVVVRKPSSAESLTATAGGHTTRIVVVGSNVWIDQGTGTFVKNAIPASAPQSMTSAFDPGTFLKQANASAKLSALQTVGVETKNGVQAIHLRADHSTVFPAGQPTMPPGATVDVWVATDGQYLVALEEGGLVSSTGPTGVKLELTNINDPSLSVKAPS